MPDAMLAAVDPANIPQRMTRHQLEWWILFTIAVAGKTAKTIEKKMNDFFSICPKSTSPFDAVEQMVWLDKLDFGLRAVKLGKYKLLNKGFQAAAKLNLHKLEFDDPSDALATLSVIPGLGPKGSRMVLMYAFPDHADEWVVLDTHILRWLREKGITAPLATPPEGRTYRHLESIFKEMAHRRGMTTRELDTEIWTKSARP